MKKITSIALTAVAMSLSLQAYAGSIAPNELAPTPQQVAPGAATCEMIASPVVITLSRNVGLAYSCSKTSAAVQGGNTKGKYAYGGNTIGGSVKQCGTTLVSATNGYNAVPAAFAYNDATIPDGCGTLVSNGS
jgi:hypothetical protein